jgi:hypothetical protein
VRDLEYRRDPTRRRRKVISPGSNEFGQAFLFLNRSDRFTAKTAVDFVKMHMRTELEVSSSSLDALASMACLAGFLIATPCKLSISIDNDVLSRRTRGE